MQSAYEYKPIAAGSIRLLSISSVEGQLSGQFSEICMKDTSEYDAISYAWGDEEASEMLMCDEQFIRITPHVKKLLHQLYRSRKSRRFWIDAICINQADSLEKEHQVRQMHEVYSAARRVLAWLGEAEDNSDLVMDSMPTLIGKFPRTSNTLTPEDSGTAEGRLTQLDLPAMGDPIWSAVEALYLRPWLSRLWVYQEIVLARELILLCGSKNLEWELLLDFMEKFKSFSLFGVLPLTPTTIETFVNVLDFLTTTTTLWCRRSELANMEFLLRVLREGRWRRTKEPVDRFYGFLGLASPGFREFVRVDYSLEGRTQYWKAYIQWGKLFIHGTQSPLLLSYAQSDYRPSGLPSWCPNLNSPATHRHLLAADPCFHAGYELELDLRFRLVITQNQDSIEFPGFRMDTVKHVTDQLVPSLSIDDFYDRQVATQTLAWEAECFQLYQAHHRSCNHELEAYARTLIADYRGYDDLKIPDIEAQYHRAKLTLSLDANAGIGDVNEIEFAETRDVHEELVYRRAFYWQQKRRFFVTHGNRIGLGARDTKPGDVVCVLYNARPVFILRFEDKTGEAQLIGEAYVDGLMRLSEVPVSERGKDEMFIIA